MYRILFLALIITFSNQILGRTIKVCKSCEVTTIQQGIDAANSHDTLLIAKGTYLEFNLHVTKPLTIVGVDYPIVDGQDKGEIFTIESDSVTIKGLEIINVGTSYTTDYAAIRIVKSENFLVEDNILKQLFFGIYLEKSNKGKVINNTILGDAVNEYSSGNGIQLWYCKKVDVIGNNIKNVRDGIYLEFSDDIQIKDNKSYDNLRYGLHFMFSNNDSYSNNIFENNGAGVAVMFSKNIKMKYNIFRKNWGTASFGLLLKEINDAEISHNVFEENTVGINIEGSNRISYKQNNFRRNGWALKVRGACYNNIFTLNNFLNNSFDVSYNSNVNDNEFKRNFWSSYAGYDLDMDGIGDVPYRPVKLFSYIVNRTPETIILLRSLFMDIIDFSEKVSPVFTPDNLQDEYPLMRPTS